MKVLTVLPPIIGYRGIITYQRTIDPYIKSAVFSTEPAWLKAQDGQFFNNTNYDDKLLPLRVYDIVHFHDCYYEGTARLGKKVIFTLHFSLDRFKNKLSQEIPNYKVDHFISISPEIKKSLDEHGLKNTYIPQPINAHHFIPTKINKEPRNILIFNNDCSPGFLRFCRSTENRAVRVETSSNILDTRELMEPYDIVVTVGRGALEAASMYKKVFIVGSTSADGYLNHHSYDDFRENNFSGRFNNRKDWRKLVHELFTQYGQDPDELLRQKIIKENDPETIAKQIKDLYESISSK